MKTYNDIEGWFNFPDFYDQIIKEFKNNNDIIMVELGVWMGKSVIYLADKIRKHGLDVKLFAIDNFIGNENSNQQNKKHITKVIVDKKYNGNFYSTYNQNVVDCGVRNIISDIQKPSLEAVLEFEDKSIDFIFIDGDHHYDAVSQDIKVWYPKIKVGGIMSGHDLPQIGVGKALNEFTKENGLKYERVSKSCWIIRK